MASNINPVKIDTTYPIAGQDNDTQGFRDNFTNIKNNFNTAASEISAIQSTLATVPSIINASLIASTFVSEISTAAGTPGQLAYDANYWYFCIGTNTWYRCPSSHLIGSVITSGVAAYLAANPPTGEYNDANVALYLANQVISSANIGSIFTHVNSLDANVATNQIATSANVGNYQVTTNANIGALSVNLATTQANLGAYQIYANANVGALLTTVSTVQANVGLFEITTNANIGSHQLSIASLATNANANTVAYLGKNAVTIGTQGANTTIGGNLIVSGNLFAQGNLTYVNLETVNTTEYVNTVNATNLYAPTIGNTGSILTGYLSTVTQPNVTSVGNLTSVTTTGTLLQTYAGSGQGLHQFTDSTYTNYVVSVGSAATGWAGSGSLNLLTYTNGNIGFFQNQTEAGRVVLGGNWLLGYTSNQSTAKLQVSGNIYTNGSLVYSDGTTAPRKTASGFGYLNPSVNIGNFKFNIDVSGNPTVGALSGTIPSNYNYTENYWSGSGFTFTSGGGTTTWSTTASYGFGATAITTANTQVVGTFTDNTNNHIYRVTWFGSTSGTGYGTIIAEQLI